MEMGCPHLTVHRKALVRGLIGSDNDGLPRGIDDPRVLAADAVLLSLIYDCWELCIKMSEPFLEMRRHRERLRDSMPHSPQSRRYYG